MNRRLRLGVTATGVAFVIAIILGATGALVPAGQAAASGVSTLTIISGSVWVRHAGATFEPAADGAALVAGDSIMTGADARAVLTYFEGSTVEMEPGSELSISDARSDPNGDTIIVMEQHLGMTWNVVTHLLTTGSRYEIHTSTATASVRGTQFTVSIAPDGTTTQTTTEGAVADSDTRGTATVLTPPGHQTSTRTGEAPAGPAPIVAPDRTVTVTVTNEDALVVDTLGRANGLKDGKKVLQTPGAQLQVVDGHLVVTLPNVPDGALTTHVAGGNPATDVTTKVEDKGKPAVELKDTVAPGRNSGVDITKGTGTAPTIEKRTDSKDAPSPKVGKTPPTRSSDLAVAAFAPRDAAVPAAGRRATQPASATGRNAGYALRLTLPVPYARASLKNGSRQNSR
jgi:FecR-like protein